MSARRSISPLLITAGPTHEPLDAVRYIGNRSSGRLGVALALEAVSRGVSTTLLLGPTPHEDTLLQQQAQSSARDGADLSIRRFSTTADLESLLREEWPGDKACLLMAAAVADYRLSAPGGATANTEPAGKLKRSKDGLHLDLEATPDLVAACAQRKRSGQLIVAFALEDEGRLIEAARYKMRRKGVDGIIANPLGTMESDVILAHVLWSDGRVIDTGGSMAKTEFADWLLDHLTEAMNTI